MEHFYRRIIGHFRWPELYSRAVRLAPSPAVFVELGSYWGQSMAYLGVEVANSGKYITLHAVDYWDDTPTARLRSSLKGFTRNLRYLEGVVQIIPHRMDTVAAADQFDDKTVDFVWLDACHTYEAVLADITAWWPKLKPGGWMGGDDLIHGGVRKAVEQYFGPECLPGKKSKGRWVRHQSAQLPQAPTGGGWCWYTECKQCPTV